MGPSVLKILYILEITVGPRCGIQEAIVLIKKLKCDGGNTDLRPRMSLHHPESPLLALGLTEGLGFLGTEVTRKEFPDWALCARHS